MAINKSSLETVVQTTISGIDTNTSAEDIFAAASSANALDTDIETFISLGCDLPDLNLGEVQPGTILFVDEFGVPVLATTQSWIGLDGRTYRKDVIFDNLYGTGSVSGRSGVYSSPVREITSSTNWSKVSTEAAHSHGIKQDGTLWSWGCNGGSTCPYNSGQLADGTVVSKLTPVRERSSSTNWCVVSADTCHSTAIKTDGTLWAWGSNNYGQLGNGVRPAYVFSNWALGQCSPVQERSSSTTWCITNGGFSHSAAIKNDGTLWTWGRNLCGVLGRNDLTDVSSPAREITSSSNWCLVSGGGYFSSALKTDGTLWSWGQNSFGGAGVNDILNKSSPVQEFTSSVTWCAVSAGGYSFSALKTDGTLWSSGRNQKGQLGLNNITCYSSPVQEITSSTNWCLITIGFTSSTALKTDGTLWSWGANYSGRLGTGNVLSYSSPIREISSSSGWTTVSAGGNGFVAILRE